MQRSALTDLPNARPLSIADADEPSIVRGMLRLVLRRARAIVGVAAIVGGVAFAVPMLQAPKFTAIASVLINPRQAAGAANPIVQSAPVSGAPDSALVDSEIEVLGSDELLRRVVTRLELAGDPEFNPALANGISLRRTLSRLLAEAGAGHAAGRGPPTDESVIAALDTAVSVRRRSLSYVVDISVSTEDPRKSALIANTIVEEYGALQRETRSQAVRDANAWLEQRLSQLRAELQAREAAVEQYRAEAGLVSAAGSSLVEQETSAYQMQVMEAQTRLAERQARYNQVQALVRAGGSADSIADVLNSHVIRDLRQRETEFARRQAELESRYGELHPAVQQGQTELDNVRAQITAEMGRILTSLRNEVEVARAQLGAMQGGLGAARSELLAGNDAQVRLRELEREAEAARSAFTSFQGRAHEIVGLDQVAATEFRLISHARAPVQPSSPDVLYVLLTALCVGLGAGLLAGLLLEQLDNTFGSAEDVEAKLGVRAVASVPELSLKALRLLAPADRHPAGYLIERPMSAFAEAFRVMQTSAAYASLAKSRRIYAVTSALPNEGKTTTAFCLARSLASAGTKTLIIDCDIRRRSLNELLDIEPRKGLVQVLKGEIAWRTVVGADEATSVHVLPTAVDTTETRNILASPAFESLLDEVGQVYENVILDCPPVLSVAEARVIASLADLTFLVVRWAKTPIAAVRTAIHQLEATDAQLHGVVLNFVDVRAPGRRSYGDSLYYAHSEGAYYVS